MSTTTDPIVVNNTGNATVAVAGNWTGTGLPAGRIGEAGIGVKGTAAEDGTGVVGTSGSGPAVHATSNTGVGVWGRGTPAGRFESSKGNCVEAVGTFDTDAIVATTTSPNHAAISGTNNGGGYGLWVSSSNAGGKGGIGLFAQGAQQAAQFDGPVLITGTLGIVTGAGVAAISVLGGDIRVNGGDVMLAGADCAEDFDIAVASEVVPGTVMTLTENGILRPSRDAYDKRVAGVISGAGDCKPGLILGRTTRSEERMPLALVGKVYCKVDAHYGSIEVGDLLTSSPTPGHAMQAADPQMAFGAVIGKALRRLEAGQGQIPILVALQ